MNNMKIVAIHQPNFFPWLGFFDKIMKSDVFLLMDTAQIPQKKPSWTNRVKIIIEKEESWCPTIELVRNYHGVIPIKDAEIVENSVCKKKIIKTIFFNYKKSRFFETVFPFVESLVLDESKFISEYNLRSIRATLDKLDIDGSKLVLTSELGYTMSKDNLSSLVTRMVHSAGGNTYLSGDFSVGYLEPEIFQEAGIELKFQNYVHPTYEQFSSKVFIPGLSIIDAFMNLGFDGVKELLHSNLKKID
jgi:hypothetical protein